MRFTIITALLAFSIFSLSSCVKSFTCTCSIDDGQGYSATAETDLTGTKKTAQTECDAVKKEMEDGVTATANCTLK